MADEPIVYKVSFDTSEIPQKLQEIKSQMDQVMGASSFSGADPSPFSGFFNAAQSAGANVAASIPSFVQSAQSNFQGSVESYGGFREVFNRVSDTTQLGYSKFGEDLQLRALLNKGVESLTRDTHPSLEQVKNSIKNQDWFSAQWMKLTNFGYDPTMPLSRREYNDALQSAGKKDFYTPGMGDVLGFGLSFAAGSVPGMALTGGVLAAKLAAYPFTAEKEYKDMMEDFVQSTSKRFLGGTFSKMGAKEASDFLYDYQRSDSVELQGYTRDEFDSMLFQFTESRGFDNIRSVDEYKNTTKKIFEDHRYVMHSLHKTSQEAVELMAGLSREFGVKDFAGTISSMNARGVLAGMSGSEMIMFGQKAAEMVRGSGYTMERAFNESTNMLANVRQMAKEGIFTPEDIRQAGGMENMALDAMKSAYNYMGSPWGMVGAASFMSAAMNGQNPMMALAGMDPNARLGATANLLSSPMSFAQFFGMRNKVVDYMGPEYALIDETLQNAEMASMLFQSKNFTSTEFYGAMKVMGMSDKEARRMTSQLQADPSMYLDRLYERGAEDFRRIEDQQTSSFSRLTQTIGRGIRSALYDPLVDNIGTPIVNASNRLYANVSERLEDTVGGILTAPRLYNPTPNLRISSERERAAFLENIQNFQGSGLLYTKYEDLNKTNIGKELERIRGFSESNDFLKDVRENSRFVAGEQFRQIDEYAVRLASTYSEDIKELIQRPEELLAFKLAAGKNTAFLSETNFKERNELVRGMTKGLGSYLENFREKGAMETLNSDRDLARQMFRTGNSLGGVVDPNILNSQLDAIAKERAKTLGIPEKEVSSFINTYKGELIATGAVENKNAVTAVGAPATYYEMLKNVTAYDIAPGGQIGNFSEYMKNIRSDALEFFGNGYGAGITPGFTDKSLNSPVDAQRRVARSHYIKQLAELSGSSVTSAQVVENILTAAQVSPNAVINDPDALINRLGIEGADKRREALGLINQLSRSGVFEDFSKIAGRVPGAYKPALTELEEILGNKLTPEQKAMGLVNVTAELYNTGKIDMQKREELLRSVALSNIQSQLKQRLEEPGAKSATGLLALEASPYMQIQDTATLTAGVLTRLEELTNYFLTTNDTKPLNVKIFEN